MCLVEGAGDLGRDAERLCQRQRAFVEPSGQRFPFEKLHHQELDAVLMADVVERADVRVAQRRDALRLALEALAEPRVKRQRCRQDFDGDDPVEARVASLVDLAHAAGPERRDDFIGAEACARCESHEWEEASAVLHDRLGRHWQRLQP